MLAIYQIVSIFAFAVNAGLGAAVFWLNRTRRIGRWFLASSLGLAFWMLCFAANALRDDAVYHAVLIRLSHVTTAVLPFLFDMLRHAIAEEKTGRRQAFREAAPWLPLLLVGILVGFHPLFVVGVSYGTTGFPSPVFGVQKLVFFPLLAVQGLLLSARFRNTLKQTRGIRREELGYCVLAAAALLFVGVSLGFVMPAISGSMLPYQLLPLCAVIYTAIVAYGIVTHRIMRVGEILRRAAAYTLLIGYLAVLYLLVYLPGQYLLGGLGSFGRLAPHILATVATAFSLAPANGWMQRVARQLFLGAQALDMATTVQRAQTMLMRVRRLEDLLDRFAGLVSADAGTDRIAILLRTNGVFRVRYPEDDDGFVSMGETHPLVRLLEQQGAPVSPDVLRRLRPTPLRRDARSFLVEHRMAVAVGVYAAERMEGMLLLGIRLSGKIFSASEQDVLQLLCNQLGTALENARLYTAIEDGKRYNDILLDALVSGVVACNAAGTTTVFNRQAQALTGLAPVQVLSQPIERLPRALTGMLRDTLETSQTIRDRDMTLVMESGSPVAVRMSSAVFRGASDSVLGALLLISDMTRLKQMEAQIRRSDRLSSIGTLAAGMAHEIKNPLVTLKTFAQLMPQQYGDEEFRGRFAELVPHEVTRIDSLVMRLLHFARPAKATLTRINLGDVLRNVLTLLEQPMRRNGIELTTDFTHEADTIMGDADLLSQAFMNFVLNAIEAMPQGGNLAVRTHIEAPAEAGECGRLRVDISDTGPGIRDEDQARIFDPFFTTKAEGTGLGLSVSHGILEEHGAVVDIDSSPDKGTTFRLTFRLSGEEDS